MTKESFTEAVNKDFSELMKSHDSERIEAYLAGDEAQSIISDAYQSGLDKKEKGYDGMTPEAFWKSCVASTAYCMLMCYE